MLHKLNPNEFESIYRIMEISFPEDERRTFDEQKVLLEIPEYQVYVMRAEIMQGFAAVWEFEDFVFVEHLAVNPSYRNGGIGSKILQSLKQGTSKKICLEVELPIEDLAIRRIGFYERNGFFYNEYEYMQPSISAGRQPVPLRIMTTESRITEQEFEHIRDTLYQKVYYVK